MKKEQKTTRIIACIALAMLFALLLVLSVCLPLQGKNVSASAAETESRIIDSSDYIEWSDFSDDTQYYFADTTISENLEIHLDFSEPSEYYVFVFFGKVRAIEIGIYIDSFEFEEINNGIYLDTYYELNTYDTLKLSFYSYTVSFAIMRTTNPDSYNPDTLQLLYDTLEAAHRYSEEHIFGEAFDSGYHQGYELGNLAGYQDGYETGRTDGYESGKTDGYKDGYEKGYENGRTDGFESGKTEGYNEGYENGKTDGYTEGKKDGYEEGIETAQYGIFTGATAATSYYVGSSVSPLVSKELNFRVGAISFSNFYDYYDSLNVIFDYAEVYVYFKTPIYYTNGMKIYFNNIIGTDTSALNFKVYLSPAGNNYMKYLTTFQSDDLGYYLELNDETKQTEAIGSITIQVQSYQIQILEKLNLVVNNNEYYNGYTIGYNEGYGDGYELGHYVGDRDGRKEGYNQGYSTGLNEGVSAAKYSFTELLTAVVDAPVKVVIDMLNFEILGINLSALLLSLMTVALVIAIIKKFT